MLNNFPILTLFIPEEELQWDLYDLLSNFKTYFDGGMMHFQSRDRGLTFLKVLDGKPSLLHNPQVHAQIVQLQDLARSIHNPELDAWLQAVQQTQVLPEWVSELGGSTAARPGNNHKPEQHDEHAGHGNARRSDAQQQHVVVHKLQISNTLR